MQGPNFNDDPAKQELENGSAPTVARSDHSHDLTYLRHGQDRGLGFTDSDYVDPVTSVADQEDPPGDDPHRRLVSWEFDESYPVEPGPSLVYAAFTVDNTAVPIVWSDYVLVGGAPPLQTWLRYVAPSHVDFDGNGDVKYVVQLPKHDRSNILKLVRTGDDGLIHPDFLPPITNADTLDGLDSTAFFILNGQSGGQIGHGGTDAGDDLVLRSTSNATKGEVRVDDPVNLASSERTPGILAPSQITANQNNYSPTGLSTARVLLLDLDAAHDLTGIDTSVFSAIDGIRIDLVNKSAFVLTMKNESGSSTAANRFSIGADFDLNPGQGIALVYDGLNDRWRRTDSAGPTGAGTGDMTKAVYDPDDDGIVVEADVADGLKETGGPTTLTMSVVADGDVLKRSGTTIVGGQSVESHEAEGDPHTQYQKESEKNAASGYAGLDGSTKLDGAQQKYGTVANTAAEGNDARLSDARTPTGSAGGGLYGTYPSPSVKSKWAPLFMLMGG